LIHAVVATPVESVRALFLCNSLFRFRCTISEIWLWLAQLYSYYFRLV